MCAGYTVPADGLKISGGWEQAVTEGEAGFAPKTFTFE